nr:phytanoyl-CoA dioxygenase family protein [Marivibrio halodurans]
MTRDEISAYARDFVPKASAAGGPGILTQDEIDAYNRDGFMVPNYRLDPDTLGRLAEMSERLVDWNPHITDSLFACPHMKSGGHRNLKTEPGWMDFATHPDILDMMEQLIGPNIILWGATLFYKTPKEGPATPWHRDARFLPITPMATTSVWIAVSPCKKDNGCLRFIPGSHQRKEVGSHRREQRDDLIFNAGTLDESEYDESTAEDVELEPGQMVFFDIFTIHGSRHNKGNRARAAYSMRYIPSTSHYDHDANQYKDVEAFQNHTRRLYLVRGRDVCGLNDFTKGLE